MLRIIESALEHQNRVDRGGLRWPFASSAILQMWIGVSMWYRPGGPLSEDDIVFQYGDIAMGVVEGPRRRRKK